tara:strand:- start:47 stop:526 length:480 start_codon:yes stop_codon:yes gene_type:complete
VLLGDIVKTYYQVWLPEETLVVTKGEVNPLAMVRRVMGLLVVAVVLATQEQILTQVVMVATAWLPQHMALQQDLMVAVVVAVIPHPSIYLMVAVGQGFLDKQLMAQRAGLIRFLVAGLVARCRQQAQIIKLGVFMVREEEVTPVSIQGLAVLEHKELFV